MGFLEDFSAFMWEAVDDAPPIWFSLLKLALLTMLIGTILSCIGEWKWGMWLVMGPPLAWLVFGGLWATFELMRK